MIVAGVDNRPSMLEKSMYVSWQSRMLLYMQEKLQADCDLKATNIVLQGLPPDVYSLVNHHKVAKEIWDKVSQHEAYANEVRVNISIPRKNFEKIWSMDTRLFKEQLSRILIWVKLHDVPIQVFEEDGRSSFARYLIEVNSEADIVNVVTIGIPSLYGNGFTKETIRGEYELRPPKCDLCKIFGHVHDHCPKKVVSPPIVTTFNVVTPTVEKTNDGFQTLGKKKKRKGKSKSTNGGQFTGPSVKQNVRYEPKANTSAPKKGVTNVGNTSQSSSMLKTTEEDVENVYDESTNLIQNIKSGGSSYFTAAAEHLPINETKLPFKMVGLLFNKFKGDRVRVLLPKRPRNSAWFKEKMLLVQAQDSGQSDDHDAYYLDCDDIYSAKAVLMANLFSYDSDVLSEVVQIAFWYFDSRCSKHMDNALSSSTLSVNSWVSFDLGMIMLQSYKDQVLVMASKVIPFKLRFYHYTGQTSVDSLVPVVVAQEPADPTGTPSSTSIDQDAPFPIAEGSTETTTERYMENYKNILQDIRDQLNAEAEAVQIILTRIDNDIYSTVDACPNACEMWKAIERLKQVESINVQDLETNLYWEFGKFTSRDGESLGSYYSRFYKMMNELVRNQCDVTKHQVNVQFLLQLQPEWQSFVTLVKQSQELKTVSYNKLYDILKQHQNEVNKIKVERLARTANPLALVSQQQPIYHPQNHHTHYTQNSSIKSQQAATRNKGKAIVNSPPPIYDKEPTMVAEDDEMSKDKEIDKLMALISLSFKKIYKPTNNNLRTSSNTSRANQDNSLRINRGTRYDNQRIVNVARENVGTPMVQKSRIQCYNYKEYGHVARECQKLKRAKDAAYHKEKMLFKHPEQSKSVNDTYPIEQDEHNVIINSLDMSYDREQVDQDDADDLAKERDLRASLIEKLKCEFDDNKNRNKFLETSNNALVDKLKGEIANFKTKNKSLESSNNHFKEANNELSKTNQLMFNDTKKFQAELDRYHDVKYASKVEINCAKAKGDLMSYKIESKKSFNEYT
uniref:Zinc knuckle CX2CX4HX4C n=1 Tax=Tanacetum cinerariifolium TaxID=118510 RepID=A0A699GKF8_TANCI|nr:zinc knuckle CX2CX4HX4C [Tanacetum cinerariifolium]